MIAVKTISTILLVAQVALAVDYCDDATQKRCTDYQGVVQPHVGCNNPGWSSLCDSGKKQIEITDAMKQKFLDAHNEKRNGIASGSVSGFGPATRMATVVWSDEMAALAVLNTKQCEMEHDKCRATAQFIYAGQNLHLGGNKPDFPKPESVITDAVNGWYGEIKDATQEDIDKFGKSTKVIGHFTAMMTAHSTHIGCGMSQYTDADGWRKTLVACNYAAPNMVGASIFVKGPAASECKATNPNFSALCAVGEDIDANKFDNMTYD